jgi:predicted Zn-dependent protease
VSVATALQPRLRLAEALLEEDRAEEAERLLQPLAGAADGATLASMTVLHLARGRPADAAACARAALATKPLPTRTLLAVAAALGQAHDYAAADAALAAAIDAGEPAAELHQARARLAEDRGRGDLARQHWQRVLNLAPGQTDAKLGLARALRGEGRFAESESLCRLLRAAAPKEAAPAAELARIAHEAGDPVGAERRWHDVLLVAPAQSAALLGLAQALTAQHRFADALAILAGFAAREPERTEPIAGLIRTLLAQGDVAAAEERARALVLRPDARPEHRLLLGRVLEAAPDGSAATAFYRELVAQTPHAPGPRLAQAEWTARQGDFETAREQFSRILADAPDHLGAVLGLAQALAELGLDEEAGTLAARAALLAPNQPRARLARAGVAETLGRLDQARLALLEARSALPWRVEPLLQLAQFAPRHGDHAAAADHGDALLAGHPRHLGARLAACDAAMAAGRQDRARAILAGLAAELPAHREVERRLARVDWQDGAVERARARWARITAYDPRIHGGPDPIRRLDAHPLPDAVGEIRAFLLVRNERLRLPWLLAYYRDLGVGRFLVLDNDSDDGTTDWLLAQGPDVHLFHTTASFAASGAGMRWTNRLLDEHGTGAWCLTVDADEVLVYPRCETARLPVLTAYLDSCAAEAMAAPMFDLYAERPLGETAYAAGQSLIEAFPWFDATGYIRRDSNDFPFFRLQGGSRARVFHEHPAAGPVLQKVPLIRWRPDIKYTSSKHTAFPCRLAALSGALLHFKYLPAFADQVGTEVARAQHFLGGKEYRAYQRRLAPGRDFSLMAPISHRYRDSDQLVELGLMQTCDAYEAHVRDRAQA